MIVDEDVGIQSVSPPETELYPFILNARNIDAWSSQNIVNNW